MRRLLPLPFVLVAAPLTAAPLDAEARAGYQLRVAVHTTDHPTLTRHFRAEVIKGVTSTLQSALGPTGSVEGIDLNATPPEKLDPLLALVAERGLDGLDGVNAATGPKTHFVFVDFADGKYVIRTRQHDGNTGFVTPFVRTQVHGDRGFVSRLAGLAVAQDFAVVGTFDPRVPQVQVVLKAGELGSLDQFVKKGDVFAVMQIREARRAVAPRRSKGKDGKEKEAPAPPARTGERIADVLLHVVDTPRNGLCVCKMYNRYKELPIPDGFTLGYRCVKLGTGEGKLRLQLTDAVGTAFRSDTLQPRAGDTDFPDATNPRAREEMTFAGGVFTSKERFQNIAFVLVWKGDTPVARIPVELYPDQLAVRRVKLDPATEASPVQQAATDLLDRIRGARIIQARVFEEVAVLQKKEKPKALEYAQGAVSALDKEADVLRADLERAKERHKADAPSALFDPCEADLKALEAKTRELRTHLVKLKEVIKIESDPKTAALHKKIEAAILEAETAKGAFDIDAAIARYEEALKLAAGEPAARGEIEKALSALKAAWELKDDGHREARKFAYETWPKLEKPAEVRDAQAAARQAVNKLKAVGDRYSLGKMYAASPQVAEKYQEALKEMLAAAKDDDERQALVPYVKVSRDLEDLLNDLGKELGAK